MSDGPLNLHDVSELVPHRGPMSLLGGIVDSGESWAVSRATVSNDSPFFRDGGIASWVGIEYMAQTVAAWAGLNARSEGRPVKIGFLVGTRRYNCNVPSFPEGSAIRTRTERVMLGHNGLGMFDCHLTGVDPVGRGFEATASLSVYQPEESDITEAEHR